MIWMWVTDSSGGLCEFEGKETAGRTVACMGAVCCHTAATAEYSAPCIAHFSIIRAIGRGAFGKVLLLFLMFFYPFIIFIVSSWQAIFRTFFLVLFLTCYPMHLKSDLPKSFCFLPSFKNSEEKVIVNSSLIFYQDSDFMVSLDSGPRMKWRTVISTHH